MKTVLILLTFVFQLNNANEVILNTLRKCDLYTKRTQASVNRCFKNIADITRHENKAGEQKWSQVHLEPLIIEDYFLKFKEGAIDIEANLSEMLLHGVSNYTITDIDTRYEHRKATITLFLPNITVEGRYIMKGNLLLILVNGAGDFWLPLDDVEIIINGKIVANKENPEFLAIQQTTARMSVKKTSIQLTNLFQGNPILDETVHQFLNIYYNQLMLNQLRPQLKSRASKGLEAAINNIFANIPVTAIYPNGI